ncbi:CDP-2,3-bis-(O-geranylgeranyl)-sn-glycerol synthase [Methanobrevibacter sp. OttesenSCG-928-K11]|nr:CDP-2,3-bis-(O-geranylgeranyl)-sn-glycerol synthase [Methanobrevibacter sp. OttesenSCG-928-K11]
MIYNLENILISCVTVLYFMLPAYFSNISGLAFGGNTPLDLGKNFKDNRRILGDGVTWKGLIAGTIIGMIVGAIQGYFGPYIIETFGPYIFTPICTNLYEGILVGFLLGFGALLGDALGSFIKRRLNIGRGEPAIFLDQLDFVFGALLLTSIVFTFDLYFILLTAILTFILHASTNMIAYLLGIKDVWY